MVNHSEAAVVTATAASAQPSATSVRKSRHSNSTRCQISSPTSRGKSSKSCFSLTAAGFSADADGDENGDDHAIVNAEVDFDSAQLSLLPRRHQPKRKRERTGNR